MALKLLQSGIQPLGQFDGKDSELLGLLGGEVVTFAAVATSDKGAADASSDGYLNSGNRVAIAKTAGTSGPFMLADEGTSGYGTLFGTVVGGTVGQVVTGGAVLGPHTATGSGKVTCWDKPGLYAVTTDAVDTTTSTGLVTNNATLAPGSKLFVMTGGLLTPNSSASGASANAWAGTYVSFETDRSLVTTPNRLVQALNSPTGSSAPTISYTLAVFHFSPQVIA